METVLIIAAWVLIFVVGIYGPELIMIIKEEKLNRRRRRSWKLSRTKRREDA